MDEKSGRAYGVLVDKNDRSFVDDIEQLKAAEQSLTWNKYGKLDPALYERLQALGPEDKVSILVRIAAQTRTQAELYAELAAAHPEAQAALAREGNPMAVGDYALAMQLENEYVELIEADIRGKVQPLTDWLERLGFAVTSYAGMPAVAVTVPKRIVEELIDRTEVAGMSLAEGREQPALDTALPSNRAP
jgi:hypothetical protein